MTRLQWFHMRFFTSEIFKYYNNFGDQWLKGCSWGVGFNRPCILYNSNK